jgi:hypothetical protein
MMYPKVIRKLRRSWRAQRDDPVTPEMRARILARDRVCVAVVVGIEHECRDGWGRPHDYRDTERLSIEHVYVNGRGFGLRRPPSDEDHLVAICHGLNRRHLSADGSRKLTEYLRWQAERRRAGLEHRRRIGHERNRGREGFGSR